MSLVSKSFSVGRVAQRLCLANGRFYKQGNLARHLHISRPLPRENIAVFSANKQLNQQRKFTTIRKDKAEVRIEELTKLISDYKTAYEAGDSPVSDFEYDKLFEELLKLEEQFPQLVKASSPTQRVGTRPKVEEGAIVFRRDTPMLSLTNTYSRQEVVAFEQRVKRLLSQQQGFNENDPIEYVCELKYDGVAVSLSYNGGRLERCLSRGDGIMGQDITRNVLKTTATNKSFPTEITEPVYIVYKNGDESGKDKIVKLKNFEVRGELLMTKQHFDNINRQRQTQNGRQFKNGRNLVAGMMRLDLGDDSSPSSISSIDVIGRIELSLVSYMLLVDKSKQETVSEVPKGAQSVVVQGNVPSHYQCLEILRKIGFTPDKHSTLANSIDGVFKFINTWETQRDSYDYLLDGVVIKLNSADQQISVGENARAPRWAIAYKFTPSKLPTKLLDITLQVGRSGKITPVAELQPIDLYGSTIARATLHNFDYILNEGITVGCTVTVEKAGDVIPKVTGTIRPDLPKEGETKALTDKAKLESLLGMFPTTPSKELMCPCGLLEPLSLEITKSGKIECYCRSIHCPEQKIAKIIYFTSRSGLDIEGFGYHAVKELVQVGLLNDPADIFELYKHKDKILSLDGWGTKRLENLLKNIETSKRSFDRFLAGVGIPHVGMETARIIGRYYSSLQSLIDASREQLSQIKSIGDVTVTSIIQFFHNPENLQLAKRLEPFIAATPEGAIPADFKPEITKTSTNTIRISEEIEKGFRGKTIVVSGIFPGDREEFKEYLRKIGVKLAASVTKRTDYLLIGEAPGGLKIRNATEYNVPILNIDEILLK